jgi:two-component system, NtrC family, sensor kinase
MTTRRSSARMPKGGKTSQGLAADLQKRLDRRTRELAKTRKLLKEALQQQSATSEVLHVINSSSVELAPVFDAMLKRAMQLCEAAFGGLWVFEGDRYVAKALCDVPPAYVGYLHHTSVVPGPHTAPYRFLHGERSAIHNIDLAAEEPYITGDPQRRALVDLGGARAALQVPLVRNKIVLGVITVYRQEVRPFLEQHVTLLQDFAAQAVIAIENTRLFNETREALERQTATADVLDVISRSPTDAVPVFDFIGERAEKLCNAEISVISVLDGDLIKLAGIRGIAKGNVELFRAHFPMPLDRKTVTARTINTGAVVHISDVLVDTTYDNRTLAEQTGYRSCLGVPMHREGQVVGAIFVARTAPGRFSDNQIRLLEIFADQAAIAIGNVRLFEEVQARSRELQEALVHQTGSANILRVIASSQTDIEPVLKTIVDNACEICDAVDAVVYLKDDDHLKARAHRGPIPIPAESIRLPINRRWGTGRSFVDKVPVHIHDLHSPEGDEFPDAQRHSALMGHRAVLAVPLLRESESIGSIVLRRTEVQPFSDKQIALLQTFADQAVIAIENVRLFDQVQAKTADLSESLQQQTATADVLKVISRSTFDLQTVLQTLVESAAKLCEADKATITRQKDGVFFRAESFGYSNEFMDYVRTVPIVPDRGSAIGRALLDGIVVHIPDVQDDADYTFMEAQRLGGFRTILTVPMLREGMPIGVIGLTRSEVRPFTDKQIELATTFADQAAIAIENVRLFEEVQAKTRDLSEALVYQTGSGNILKVIASSPTDVEPVLNAIVASACKLCEAYDAVVLLEDGNDLRFAAHHGPININLQKWPINRNWIGGRAFVDQKPVHVRDLLSDEGSEYPDGRELSQRTDSQGIRSILGVPLLREDHSIGTILLRRTEVNPFSDKQVALLQTFANQAVIAIGNVRLFEEVQAKTHDLTESLQQQTATADVLKVISASPGELGPVFQAMLENAVRLCEAKFAMLFLLEDDQFRAVGMWNLPPVYREYLATHPIRVDPKVPLGRVVNTKQPVQVPDVLEDQAYIEGYPGMVGVVELGGARTLLQVPMLKDDQLVGTFGIYRQEVRPFTDKQVALVQNFAAQAVIAIENARLLNELRARTNDLSASLEELRTAQDRLIQTEKLASLGQLTAGIAHEIKNPLNFVNNFSALSAELTEELNDLLKSAALGDKMRGEVDELTGLLKDNLEKVVQHGKRADSIVKNMLLHSREGSGEHRPADINMLLDESLNLAYHGARAEKGEFNITLQRDFDAGAGTIELFPQEITRAFLNLIANGVYAATRRKMEDKEPGFEPTLRATTKNLGTAVEIRFRDNGTGIPAEVQEKMFHPFFTTKPAGEGTGLGLSMTHDIIVKQHGGRIDVATEPGQFTEFTIVLPRKTNLSGTDRGKP